MSLISLRERDREWLKFYSWIKIPSLIVGADQQPAFSRFIFFSASISYVFLRSILSQRFGADQLPAPSRIISLCKNKIQSLIVSSLRQT